MNPKKLKKIGQTFGYLAAIGVSILFLFFFLTSVWIGHEVKQLCQTAQWDYGKKDCVEALISQLNDVNRGFRIRNHAVWALGQLGDSRAVPALQNHYTGIIPEREPLDQMISQYELTKAIKLAQGAPNITAWAWRWGLN